MVAFLPSRLLFLRLSVIVLDNGGLLTCVSPLSGFSEFQLLFDSNLPRDLN